MSIASEGIAKGVLWRHDKRWLWIASVLSPAMPAVGATILLLGGDPLWSWFALAYGYVASDGSRSACWRGSFQSARPPHR